MTQRAVARVRLAAGVILITLAGGSTPAAAQLPADASWRTVRSTHFRVTYEADLEQLARHAAASAERAHVALAALVGDAPGGTIDIVLADHTDQSNGYATPFPSNRIVVYAKPPVDLLELQYTRDWIELVVTHELAHVFHLDATSGFGHLLRTIFGRAPLPWPVFPAVGVPLWNVEGLAVGAESAVTGLGRVHGSYNEMVVRTAALAGRLDEYDRLGSSSARWPGGSRVYVYGSLFMDYLARRYGADAAARLVRSTRGAVIPPPLWFGRVGINSLGITFRDAYRDWEREVTARSDSLAMVLRSQGVTSGTVLTGHRAIAQHPRFSPDGSRIAYAAHDWRTPPRVRVIDAATGAEHWSERMNQPAPAAWAGSDRLIASEIDFVARFRTFGDLHIIGSANRQLTRGERLQDPDISTDGRIVAIQNEGGTNRLVLVDGTTGAVSPITHYDADTHWALPRLSPGGDRIAVSRWRMGGAYEIVVLDAADPRSEPLVIADDTGINAAPAWSPDGRWILFSSDRTGIPNIYAVDIARMTRDVAAGMQPRPALRQVTNVLTGAFHPDISPDGRSIAYSAYTDEGFRIERMPFDTSLWRDPAPAGLVHSIVPRMQYTSVDTTIAAAVQATANAVALAKLDSTLTSQSADTVAGEERRYNPLHSLRPYFWFPVIRTGAVENATFLGIWSFGEDLIGRHAWDASVAVHPGDGRTRGWFGYTYRGLPTLGGIGMHPSVSAVVERDWDTTFPPATSDDPYVDEREDLARLALDLTRTRWRSSTGIGIAAESVRRSRHLYDAPDLTLADPHDALWGVRASAFTATYVVPPLSISREDGFTLQIAARQRWEPETTTIETDDGPVTFDAAYRELTSWNTAYIALPLPGFARHVLAARFSGLLRDGPGAGISRVGGASGSGFRVPGTGYDLGGSSSLLPVRGFARGARFGSNAWTASLEYRAPIALIDKPLRPFFFDRISAAVFADAGHAWCSQELAALTSACSSTSPSHASLIAAGGELTAVIGFLGFNAPVRVGAGVPLRGAADSAPRFYIQTGPSF